MAALAAFAQASPDRKPPVPQAELRDPKACVNARAEVDKDGNVDVRDEKDRSLSEQLARSDGVICPPPDIDPAIKQPTPDVGKMPVIPPPGHNDPTIRPK